MGWIWCVRFEKINCNFFRSSCSDNGPRGRISHVFEDRNKNWENTPDTCFGSNGVDWVRSNRKNQLELFSLHKWPDWPSGSGFVRVLVTETETTKTHQT